MTKLQEIVMVMMMMMFDKNALMALLVIGKILNTERISSIARLLVGLCIIFYSRYHWVACLLILIHVCKINGLGAAEWDLIQTSTMSVLFTAYLFYKKRQLNSALFRLLRKSREGTSINTAGKRALN